VKRLLAISGAALAASPALAASGSGSAEVKVIKALAVVNEAALDFGNIIPTAAGTVTVNAQTGAATHSGVTNGGGGTISAARFFIAATPNRVVSFSLNPNNNLVLNRIGGGASMTVQQFRASFNGGAPSPLGPNRTVPASGAFHIQIGGRLNVAAAQMEGVYEGTFVLNIDYQ
jgi:hypothetical protein